MHKTTMFGVMISTVVLLGALPAGAEDGALRLVDQSALLEHLSLAQAAGQPAEPGAAGQPGAAAQPAGEQPPQQPMEPDRTAWFGAVREDFYVGGRGLITIQGMAGMFLNPTSGTLGQGQFTVQWCTLVNDELLLPSGADTGVDVWGNGVMGAYGVTDWLEVGGFGLMVVADPSPFKTSGDKETLSVGGPFVRVRLIQDQDWMPEVSVGGIHLDGDASSDVLSRQEIFVAISKHFPIDEDGFFRGCRLHGGVRQIWRHDRPDGLGIPANGTVPYVGIEIELPWDIYFVSEISTKDDVLGARTPFAFGIQWKPNQVVGISIAGMQPGDAQRISFYAGVGLNWEF